MVHDSPMIKDEHLMDMKLTAHDPEVMGSNLSRVKLTIQDFYLTIYHMPSYLN